MGGHGCKVCGLFKVKLRVVIKGLKSGPGWFDSVLQRFSTCGL